MTELLENIKRVRTELEDEYNFYNVGVVLITSLADLIEDTEKAEQQLAALVKILESIRGEANMLDALAEEVTVNGEDSIPDEQLDAISSILSFARTVRSNVAQQLGLPDYDDDGEDDDETDAE